MVQSKIQKEAAKKLAEAMELVLQAQDKLRLADRFPVEPEPFTVLQFDKEFPTPGNALEAAGLNFDPNKLVPNLRPAGLEKLAQVIGGYNPGVLVVDSEDFAEAQRTSYRYVAIRIGDAWFTTARGKNSLMPWDKLVEFIGDSPCWVVESWREIPVEPSQVIEMADDVEQDARDTAEAVTLADALGANRRQVMEVLRKLRANGKNPTPKAIVDALAKIGAEEK